MTRWQVGQAGIQPGEQQCLRCVLLLLLLQVLLLPPLLLQQRGCLGGQRAARSLLSSASVTRSRARGLKHGQVAAAGGRGGCKLPYLRNVCIAGEGPAVAATSAGARDGPARLRRWAWQRLRLHLLLLLPLLLCILLPCTGLRSLASWRRGRRRSNPRGQQQPDVAVGAAARQNQRADGARLLLLLSLTPRRM